RQFGEIVVKTESGGRVTYLKDVATIELGAQTYDQFSLKGGKPAASLGIFQLPGSNALAVAQNVRKAMEELKTTFPPGLRYEYPIDTTEFVDASIHEVYKTLIE